jgi:hypothetical protein
MDALIYTEFIKKTVVSTFILNIIIIFKLFPEGEINNIISKIIVYFIRECYICLPNQWTYVVYHVYFSP